MKNQITPEKSVNTESNSKELILGILLTVAILDHTRLFFHYWNTNPGNLDSTTPMLFFTRFISHFFAPTVFFITGTYLFQWSQRKSSRQVFYNMLLLAFLLIVVELLINNFLWTFDFQYRTIGLFIIGAHGLSIGLLAFLQFMPKKILLIFSILVLIGHHLLDGLVPKDDSLTTTLWSILHQQKYITDGERLFVINYTIIPWFAILSSGYAVGHLYKRKWLLPTGIMLTALFFILRGINFGDPQPWIPQETFVKTLLSFFSVTKYPASFDFICITLGPVFIFLHFIKDVQNRVTIFFITFGSSPLFTYLLSTLMIHFAAMAGLCFTGISISEMVTTSKSYEKGNELSNYGYSLGVIYLLWIVFVFPLYRCCKFYQSYTRRRFGKVWF